MSDPQLRPDQSSFLVHLTREYEGKSPMENLLAILKSKRIEARTVNCLFIHTMKRLKFSKILTGKFKTVSLTETPIQTIHHLADPHIDRTVKLALACF